MINIDYLTIKAFTEENIDFLIGARVQKIQQPTRRDLILSVRNNGESRKLYININPQYYHIAFMSAENEEKRNIVIPKQPPMFCMLLRKYLEGVKITDVLAVENERIFELHFEIIDELSQNRSLCLAAELMGKHSNIILYDRETSVIIGCAHNIGEEKSRYRELKGGIKYAYPPSGLNNTGKVVPLYKQINNSRTQNISGLIDEYYSQIQERLNLKSEKSKLEAIVTGKLKGVNNSATKIEQLLKKRDNTEKYKHFGELLTANLYLNTDFQKQAELFDYTTGEIVIISLDEKMSMKENAQRYFKLYAKSKSTKEKSAEILENLRIEKDYYENLLYSIKAAKNLSELEEIKPELGIAENKPKQKKSINLTQTDINGFRVYIGKNNKQNDYIISKLSRDEDYWFHTRLCAGSHILLQVKEKEPDEETIFECCKLARKYSSASQPSKVGVIYTKRKHLKKPPGAPLGYVTYKNEKEILI